jgi:hypothetical protein
MTSVSPVADTAAGKEHPTTSDQGPHRGELPIPSTRARCFALADRWFHRLVNLQHALHRGFWLGCLRPEDLNAITTERYDGSQMLTSTEYLQSGLFDWEAPLVRRYFRQGSRVLVAAAGTGREVLALRKAGFNAEGFECNLNLLNIGQKMFRQLGETYPVTFCPPDRVPLGERIYDGLILGWSGYTHIPTKARRIQFLEALRQRALPHSPLLLSFFSRAANPSRYELIAYRMARICRLVFRAANEQPVELGDSLDARQYLHRFTRDECQAELNAAGFEMVHYRDDFGSGVAVALAKDLTQTK